MPLDGSTRQLLINFTFFGALLLAWLESYIWFKVKCSPLIFAVAGPWMEHVIQRNILATTHTHTHTLTLHFLAPVNPSHQNNTHDEH